MKTAPVPLIVLMLLILFAPSRVLGAPGNELMVSAALSLKAPFEELGKAFEQQHPGTKVTFNFGASGVLAVQIAAGAAVDVFASAAEKEMDDLVAKGLIAAGTRADFAGNEIVLVVPKGSGSRPAAFGDLAASGFRRIAIGNPKTVPAGRYAFETLDRLHVWETVREKCVYAENVRQVLDYVGRGEVDAGMVFATDAKIAAARVDAVLIAPPGSHSAVRYPVAVLNHAGNPDVARMFADFLSSERGRTILRAHGFAVP